LGTTHGPSHNGAQMRYTEVLGHELMLRAHIIVEWDPRKGTGGSLVRWGGRLAIAKQSGNNNKIVLRVEKLGFAE
jgi:hypothetical protein